MIDFLIWFKGLPKTAEVLTERHHPSIDSVCTPDNMGTCIWYYERSMGFEEKGTEELNMESMSFIAKKRHKTIK